MAEGFFSFPDAEIAENAVQDVVGGHNAGNLPERIEPRAQIHGHELAG